MAWNEPTSTERSNREFEAWNRSHSGASYRDPPPDLSGGCGFSSLLLVFLLLAPFLVLAYAFVVLGNVMRQRLPEYREVLERVLPDDWFASRGAAGEPWLAGLTVLAVALGLLVAVSVVRWKWVRHWVATGFGGRWILLGGCWLLDVLRTLVVLGGLVAASGAVGIAAGQDLLVEPDAGMTWAGRWIVVSIGVGLWSLWFALRTSAKARWRHWEQQSAG